MKLKTTPNILWIQTDEHRPDSLGCYGSRWAKTPNIDSLARRGVVMQNAVCQSPLCVPSRSSQLTCLYPQECNTLSNFPFKDDIFPKGTITFPQVFREVGYETRNIGGISHPPDHTAWEYNEEVGPFDQYATYANLNKKYKEEEYHVIKRPGLPEIMAGTYPVYNGNPSQVITDKAIDFLRSRSRKRPFLLRVNHYWPHTPVLPPPPFDQKYKAEEIPIRFYDEDAYRGRAARDRALADLHQMKKLEPEQIRQIWKDYMGLVAYVDYELGRLLAVLDDLRLTEDTIVIFSADHGRLLGEWGEGEKCVFDDQAWRVPFIWSWPEHIAEDKVCLDLCELIDTGRTLLCLAGLPGKIPEQFRGRDLFNEPAPEAVFGQIGWPNYQAPIFLSDEDLKKFADWENSICQGCLSMRLAIRTRQFRLDLDWVKDGCRLNIREADGNLFDLVNDPQEKFNFYHHPLYQAVIGDLIGKLENWYKRLAKNREIFGDDGEVR